MRLDFIDLRSDTVTKPSEGMRRAMAAAEVGDDVYGEDPSINRLQERAADLLGKEAALFVPSGTMANQIALRSHTRHGDVALATDGAHLLRYESGAAAALSGLQVQTLGPPEGICAAVVEAAVPAADAHRAPVSVLCLEITHNAAGGVVPSLAGVRDAAMGARKKGLTIHMDGARLFNAVVASGVAAARWAEPFDTVSFCLSKGLGAPVGSLLCSTRARAKDLHRFRKMLGGGMRQAGVLAAAGLYALEHHVERLGEDHENARRLSTGLQEAGFPGVSQPDTNIVLAGVPGAAEFVRRARAEGVLLNAMGPDQIRAVTHLDVSRPDIDRAVDLLSRMAPARARE